MNKVRISLLPTLLALMFNACTLPAGEPLNTEPPQVPVSTLTSSPAPNASPTSTFWPTRIPTATPLAVIWNEIGLPTGAQITNKILVHPHDENIWYVIGLQSGSNSENSLFVTRDAGQTWETVFPDGRLGAFTFDPANPERVYLSNIGDLLISTDNGQNWQKVHRFDSRIMSLHISPRDGAIYVLPSWYSDTNPGVYRSDDGGQSWKFFAYGSEIPNFLPWDIAEDPNTGTLYVVIEIADHPQPYDPPFYRSTNRGETWEDVGEEFRWHGLSIQIDPLTSDVFFLSEGAGLYKSSDIGSHWQRISPQMGFAGDLLLDPGSPPRLFGGDLLHLPLYEGGMYFSDDGGESFIFLGLEGHYITDIAINASRTRLYVVSRDHGIYTASIPAP